MITKFKDTSEGTKKRLKNRSKYVDFWSFLWNMALIFCSRSNDLLIFLVRINEYFNIFAQY